jgi:RNA polymerase sigma-70 factor (ECF subfamily)
MGEEHEPIERAIRERWDARDYEAAATVLLRGYGREILAFLVSRLREPGLAGDVFSQFTEDLWRGLPAFAWRSTARVWAYTLARHALSRQLKVVQRERRRRVPLSGAPGQSKVEKQVRTETLRVLKTEVRDRMAELRQRLTSDDQMLLLLRVNRSLDWRDIAQVMLGEGEPIEAVQLDRESARLRKRFQLIKQQLRKMAEEEGLLDGDT